jgi:hypothetical protein
MAGKAVSNRKGRLLRLPLFGGAPSPCRAGGRAPHRPHHPRRSPRPSPCGRGHGTDLGCGTASTGSGGPPRRSARPSYGRRRRPSPRRTGECAEETAAAPSSAPVTSSSPLGSERFDSLHREPPADAGARLLPPPAKWGRDGTLHLLRFFREAHRRLRPGGRAVFLHELADARRVLRLARRRFRAGPSST